MYERKLNILKFVSSAKYSIFWVKLDIKFKTKKTVKNFGGLQK